MQDYKSLYAAVTIYSTLIDPKLNCYILTPVTLKSWSNLK